MCLKNVKLGGNCSLDEECIVEDSKCHSVCRCKTSHIISSDGKECLPSEDPLDTLIISNRKLIFM